MLVIHAYVKVFTVLNISCDDVNPWVSVRSALFVPEPECMHHFVHCGAFLQACAHKWDVLLTTRTANIGKTSVNIIKEDIIELSNLEVSMNELLKIHVIFSNYIYIYITVSTKTINLLSKIAQTTNLWNFEVLRLHPINFMSYIISNSLYISYKSCLSIWHFIPAYLFEMHIIAFRCPRYPSYTRFLMVFVYGR